MAAKTKPVLGDCFEFDHPGLLVASGFQENELGFLLHYLLDEGLIVDPYKGVATPTDRVERSFAEGRPEFNYCMTAKGRMCADELRARRAASMQGFVAMSFAPELQSTWSRGFEPAIRGAGYRPLRIDNEEHIDRIDDRILAEIRRSLFVVVDLTLHRPNVYYEAGFAGGIGKPIIFTCRAYDTGERHFDIRQFNCLDWADPGDLARRLKSRICAVLGDGPERKKDAPPSGA